MPTDPSEVTMTRSRVDALRSRAVALDPEFMSDNMRCSNRQAKVIEAITMREPVEY
jgi:CoA:oxalate CoA-transferase